MKLIIHVVSGPARGKKIAIQNGERARFGSNAAADVYLADPEMAEIHFEVVFQGEEPQLQALDDTAPTLVNDKPVLKSTVVNGDQISAGQSRMSVSIPSAKEPEFEADPDPESKSSPEPTPPSIDELISTLDLDDDAVVLAGQSDSIEKLIDHLIEAGFYADAVKVLAAFLPIHESIRWAYRVIQSKPIETWKSAEKSAASIVETWLNDDSEVNRQSAMSIAEELEHDGPLGFLAAAVAWSGGSMVDDSFAPVAPPPGLSARMAAGSIQLMLCKDGPDKIDSNAGSIFAIGKSLVDCEKSTSISK
ncbi:FHA domain-containing protein [Roseiconus lacunae]|uniref:FHA domain-containing protein n=1 Tax=Roseiconus lacunae TaxID=2605694 RepID=A0ABT7PE23_9BACT|nr:FHA domain-containing protein [Roseiconus lacunae]MDM4014754.1 FHA domain-containing protein [Roseiconus lacunae]